MTFNVRQSIMAPEVLVGRQAILDAMFEAPLPRPDVLRNLGLYVLPMDLKRFLFFDSIYRRIQSVPGIICEFGCRWGQNIAILQGLRAIYEPLNPYRLILGFDTFEGLRGVKPEDGEATFAVEGAYAVADNYKDYLTKLLALKEGQGAALTHLQRFLVLKGDASDKLEEYLHEHPETLIAFAYFDMDIYAPTAKCLKLIQKHLTKGSVVGFDELNFADFPGEPRAFQEVVGSNTVELRQNPYCGAEMFYVVD
jgi:hypothetical protein